MIVSVPAETVPGERRVALVPDLVPKLVGAGLEVVVQPGADAAAGFPDSSYQEKGARLEPEVLARADILLKVQPPTDAEAGAIKEGATLIGFLQPYTNAAGIKALAARLVAALAPGVMPRGTHAQSLDALSATCTLAGYQAA